MHFSVFSIFHEEVTPLTHFVIVSNVPPLGEFTGPKIRRAYSPDLPEKKTKANYINVH